MVENAELELISMFDFQVLNNGMMGWVSNHGYQHVFDYIEILQKRNSELDQKVSRIFKKATIAALQYHQYKEATFIPEIEEIYEEAENVIEECSKLYHQVAKEFMSSYGMEDYSSSFSRRILGDSTTLSV